MRHRVLLPCASTAVRVAQTPPTSGRSSGSRCRERRQAAPAGGRGPAARRSRRGRPGSTSGRARGRGGAGRTRRGYRRGPAPTRQAGGSTVRRVEHGEPGPRPPWFPWPPPWATARGSLSPASSALRWPGRAGGSSLRRGRRRRCPSLPAPAAYRASPRAAPPDDLQLRRTARIGELERIFGFSSPFCG